MSKHKFPMIRDLRKTATDTIEIPEALENGCCNPSCPLFRPFYVDRCVLGWQTRYPDPDQPWKTTPGIKCIAGVYNVTRVK